MFIELFEYLSEIVRNREINHITEEKWKEVLLWVEQIEEILTKYNITPLQAFILTDISKTGESYTDTSSILKRIRRKFPNLSLSINRISDECLHLINREEPLGKRYYSKKDELCLRPSRKGKKIARQLMKISGISLLPELNQFNSIIRSLENNKMNKNFLEFKKGQKFDITILDYPKRGRARKIEITIVNVTISPIICTFTGLNECFVLFKWNCPSHHETFVNFSFISYSAQNAYLKEILIACSDPACKFQACLTPALRYSVWRYYPK